MSGKSSKTREKGSAVDPEGGEKQPDGSYVFPNETVDLGAEETDEEREAREALALVASEQASFVDMPREQGTVVSTVGD